jgi:hypothetical protein
MAAHPSPASYTGAIYAISASLPATQDAAGYGATTITYTTIGEVDKFPKYGAVRDIKEFNPISGNTTYSKGVRKFGGGQMSMADMPGDAGQIILKAAEASPNHYSMKVTYPDGEIHYFDVLVSSWEQSDAAEGEFMLRFSEIRFCKPPVIVAAA